MFMMRTALAAIALVFALSAPAVAKEVMDVADLVETHGPAVVNISTTKLVKRNTEGFPFVIPDEEDMQEFFRRFFPPGVPADAGRCRRFPRAAPAPASSSATTATS